MTALATWMARNLWRAMLWLMRRQWMKSLQRNSMHLVPSRLRERARIGMVRQNKIARRIGLPMLIFMMSLLVGTVLISSTFLIAMRLYESGYLSIPRRLRRQMFLE
jgi:hypothetical protein